MKSSEIDSSAIEPDIDIDPELQAQILEFEKRLGHEDHYSLLGVPPDAPKSEIKRAYFDLMNVYHSDRFYGKNVGNFGPILLKITDCLTRASDTLGRNKTRAEYDSYLESRRNTLGARASIAPAAVAPHTIDLDPIDTSLLRKNRPAVAPIDVFSSGPRPVKTIHLPEEPNDEPSPDSSDEENLSSPSSSSLPPPRRQGAPTSDAARKLLARKMGHRARAPSNQEQVRRNVRENLKARYDGRKQELESKVQRLLDQADRARSAGDWSAAVAGVRMAAELKADDRTIQVRLASIQAEADRALAPRFIEQAKYEEGDGQFARAARSYERAAKGKNAPNLYNRGAECLLHLETLDEGETRMVVDLARSAVKGDPQKAAYRITLARAYAVAGMKTSAIGELKRALESEPENLQAKSLLKALK